MVRLEKEGETLVFIATAEPTVQDVEVLLEAIEALKSNASGPDSQAKIDAGLRYLDNTSPVRLREELKKKLQEGIEYALHQDDL